MGCFEDRGKDLRRGMKCMPADFGVYGQAVPEEVSRGVLLHRGDGCVYRNIGYAARGD
jgi:hypothetical protein